MNEPNPSEPLNPYLASPGESPALPSKFSPVAPDRPPRVWTAFVTIIAALVLTIGASVAGAIILVFAFFINGGTPDELQAEANSWAGDPVVFMVLGGCGQLALVFTALGAAWLSPQPLARRLGFVRPAWPLGTTILTVVASIVPFAIGIGLALLAHSTFPWLPTDPTVAQLYENMTPALAVPWVLFIALAPGFSEEMLFRGYVQRRLIERWPAWVGILITSIAFALFHIMPQVVLFAFPLGVWLGMMAWKSGSVWPGIVCHAAVNGLWNIYQVGAHFDVFPDDPPLAVLIGILAVGVVALGWSLWVMFTWRQDSTNTPASRVLPAP